MIFYLVNNYETLSTMTHALGKRWPRRLIAILTKRRGKSLRKIVIEVCE